MLSASDIPLPKSLFHIWPLSEKKYFTKHFGPCDVILIGQQERWPESNVSQKDIRQSHSLLSLPISVPSL